MDRDSEQVVEHGLVGIGEDQSACQYWSGKCQRGYRKKMKFEINFLTFFNFLVYVIRKYGKHLFEMFG